MKKLKFIFLFLVITCINCERDDICAESTSTTPRLIIEFYDVLEPDDLTSVPRISVYGLELFLDENDTLIPPEESSDSIVEYDDTYLFNVNSSEIGLPLIIGNENEFVSTRFVLEKNTNLRLDDNANTNSNIDIIEITYTSRFEYVSRACGYKSVFTNIDINIDPDGTDDDIWIENIQIEETIIEDEDTAHYSFYF